FNGQVLYEPIPQAALSNWTGDGVHALGYCQSSPTTCSDPLGLFGFIPGLMTGLDMATGALGLLDDAHRGNMPAFGLSQLATGYSTNQEFLFEAVGNEHLSDGLIQQLQGDGARLAQFAFATISRGNNGIMGEGNPWWVPIMAGGTVPAAAPMARGTTGPDVTRAFMAAKQHGSDQHFMRMYRDTLSLVQNYDIDPASIQINRAVRDDDGSIIRDKDGRYKRPDVHMRTRDGRLIILEVGVSQTQLSLRDKGVWYQSNLAPHSYHTSTPDNPLQLTPRKRPGRRR
ncbi:MAG TPA: hypothetical protein VEB22_08455, partial [Phycisphaerales bacterium]|nr:hypothetical protein [Phycisphaerales bacterium]